MLRYGTACTYAGDDHSTIQSHHSATVMFINVKLPERKWKLPVSDVMSQIFLESISIDCLFWYVSTVLVHKCSPWWER